MCECQPRPPQIDARGKYVIPGLTDANLHLFLNPDLETLIKYEDRYHEIVLEAAQIALKTGQTTVFDTWGPRAALVRARDLINSGKAPGSRIYLAGNIIGFDAPLSRHRLARSGQDRGCGDSRRQPAGECTQLPAYSSRDQRWQGGGPARAACRPNHQRWGKGSLMICPVRAGL
jgi:hypothetical protein